MLDNTDKAERYCASMLTYQELAQEAEFSFQRDLYWKVAARYRAMAMEALELADAEARRNGISSQLW
jgi:hypothetical protein